MNGEDTEGKHVFQDIYFTYNERIRRYLTRLVGEGDADDLTQEVFMKVERALGDFRGESQLSTWIYRIARNTAMDGLRSPDVSRADKTSHSIVDCETDIEDRNVWSGMTKPLPDQQLIRKQMNNCIREVIDGLPDDYRSVLIMSELEGLTNAEIAEVADISLDTAKIRLHRARKKLRKALEAKCNFYHDERNELMLRKTKNLVDVQHAMGHKDSRMTLRYAHLLPDDLKSAYEAIDNEGTASIFSRFLHVEENKKGVASATP